MIEDLDKIKELLCKEGYLQEIAQFVDLGTVQYKSDSYPLSAFVFGSKDPQAPTLYLTGGVHGLERIGAELCLSILKLSVEKLVWDHIFRKTLENIRIVFFPLVNPAGYYHFMRSNPQGVDLMRNAPGQVTDKIPWLLGGHRFSNRLPWYKGLDGEVEIENQKLFQIYEDFCRHSRCLISLDFHSGFGLRDRLWFPYSFTHKPFEHLPQLHSFASLLEQTYPYHIYKIEPQSHGYLLSGDIWDYLFDRYLNNNEGTYLPLTLEMGSWNWVKKNPTQIFSKHGLFNPIKEHRVQRTYRRHHLLFEFILRALYSNEVWASKDKTLQSKHRILAMERWYGSSK